MTPTVFIVTSVHNSLTHTQAFIRSLRKSSYPNLKIIVTDDGSTDGTASYLAGQKGLIRVPGNGKLWWTGGLNTAIRRALQLAKPSDYLLTINNDCVIPPKLIEQMLALSQKHHAVIGAVEKDLETHRITTGSVSMDWQQGKWSNNQRLTKPAYVDYHTTKGLLLPINIVKKVGLLDEKHFPHYASDIEYTHRLTLLGYKLLVDPTIFVYCDQGRTGLVPQTKTSFLALFRLAVSRKSTINLLDHFYLIKFTCPPQLRLKNYFRLLGKSLYLVKSALISL